MRELDGYIDIFQGITPKGVLAKHPQGVRLLREIYDKAFILENRNLDNSRLSSENC